MRITRYVALLIMVCCFAEASAAGKEKPPGASIEFVKKTLKGGVELAIFKIDPARHRLACAYANPPKTVGDFAKDSKAALAVNAGYWAADYKPTDLLVVEGQTIKKANLKNLHWGLFYVSNKRARVRDLRYRPFAKGERFEHAVKCGPTLVLPGGRANKLKSVSRHARTAVGRDKSGRLFFVLTERGRLTYADLTKVLLDDAIDADYAFNLDGGSSVSYCYRTPDGKVHERHGVPVSSVILVLAP